MAEITRIEIIKFLNQTSILNLQGVDLSDLDEDIRKLL